MGDEFDRDFLRIAPTLIEIANTAQQRVSANALEYIPEVLDATGQASANRPQFTLADDAFVGVTGAGLPTETMLYGAVTTAKAAVADGATTREALGRGGSWLSAAFGGMLADTWRGVEGFETYSRPVAGYVRMLQPPSCGRCVILAGKWYRKNAGFDRHPGCDCVHIPASESIGGDMTVSADRYLGSLNDNELAKTLGSRANAQAWRDYGADSRRIVNAYRRTGSVGKAQPPWKVNRVATQYTDTSGNPQVQILNLRATVEGTGTRRASRTPRLMPESIFAMSSNRTQAEHLLRVYGWIY